MADRRGMVYGFPMDLTIVLQYAVKSDPEFRVLLETRPFGYWHAKVFASLAMRLGSKAGIPDLAVRSVWLGNGVVGLCWVLPNRFRPENLTEEKGEKILKLEEILGMEEPRFYTCSEYAEPRRLKKLYPDTKFLDPLSLNYIIKAFNADGKGTVEKLLAGNKSLIQNE